MNFGLPSRPSVTFSASSRSPLPDLPSPLVFLPRCFSFGFFDRSQASHNSFSANEIRARPSRRACSTAPIDRARISPRT